MKGIWIILGIVLIVVIIVGAILFTGSNNSETGGTGATGGNQGSGAGSSVSNGAEESNTGDDNAESTTTPTTHDVEISGFSFQPATLTIKKGDTVKWTNQDSASHTVTSDSGSELDSELLSNEQSYSHTFDEAGTFDYHCAPHSYMKAKIIVE